MKILAFSDLHGRYSDVKKKAFNLVLALNKTEDEYLLFKEIEDFLTRERARNAPSFLL